MEKRKSACSSSSRQSFDDWNLSNQEVKFVYSTRATVLNVGILLILVYFYPLGYCFGLILGPCCAMFMAWDGFIAGLKGCFRDEFGLKHYVYGHCQNASTCCSGETTQLCGFCNPRAHYCMGLAQ